MVLWGGRPSYFLVRTVAYLVCYYYPSNGLRMAMVRIWSLVVPDCHQCAAELYVEKNAC